MNEHLQAWKLFHVLAKVKESFFQFGLVWFWLVARFLFFVFFFLIYMDTHFFWDILSLSFRKKMMVYVLI